MAAITLAGLVEAASSRFPNLAYHDGGSRADAAAEYAERHQARFIGNLPNGHDFWAIDDHICTIKGRYCDCRDQRAPMHDGGRLCKHRLAAMFVTKLEWAAMQRIRALMDAAPDHSLVLRVEVLFGDDGRHYRLMGHRLPGLPWEAYPHAELYPFTQALFDHTMRQAGWQLAERPIRQRNFCYNYVLSKGAGMGYTLADLTGEDVDRAAQRKRFEEIEALLDMQKEIE